MPGLPDHQREQWRAFHELKEGRKIRENRLQPIEQSEMESWFNNNDIETDERQEFVAVILELDKMWRAHTSEKQSKQRKKDGEK